MEVFDVSISVAHQIILQKNTNFLKAFQRRKLWTFFVGKLILGQNICLTDCLHLKYGRFIGPQLQRVLQQTLFNYYLLHKQKHKLITQIDNCHRFGLFMGAMWDKGLYYIISSFIFFVFGLSLKYQKTGSKINIYTQALVKLGLS